jgi:peptidoglycan/LPS O-acetylase OafA/YrhL
VRLAPLDGIRALAVLAVLAAHASYNHYPGGFLGVEVFFVLSGFLITSLLTREFRDTGRISRRAFYMRRFLRLGPALVLCLVVAGVLTVFTPRIYLAQAPSAWSDLAVVLYVSNWVQYFSPGALGLLAHTWSLGIEEQFYILWPLLLAVALPVLSPRARWQAAAVGMAFFGLVTAATNDVLHQSGSYLYFASWVHAPALLAGCALSLYLDQSPGRFFVPLWVGALAGAVVLAMSAVVTPVMPFMYNGGFLVADLGAMVLIGHAVTSSGLIARLLAHPVLTYIGRISYGIYLFHFPVFVWSERFRVPHSNSNYLALTAFRFGLVIALAAISFHLVEQRFLRLKERWSVVREPLSAGALHEAEPRGPAVNPGSARP